MVCDYLPIVNLVPCIVCMCNLNSVGYFSGNVDIVDRAGLHSQYRQQAFYKDY